MSTRSLTIAVLGFAAVLGLGASGEMVLALDPRLFPPEATAIPFIAAHQTSWALRSWMLGSNLLNLSCAVTFASAALAIRRGQAHGWRRLRLAAAVLGSIALVGVPVCLGYLLPLPSGPAESESRFLLFSVVAASLGLATICAFLLRHATNALIRSPQAGG